MTIQSVRDILYQSVGTIATTVLLDTTYEPVSVNAIEMLSVSWLQTLPNECVTRRDGNGGKSILIPVWIAEAGDCDRHASAFYSHVQVGEWLAAIRTKDGRGGAGVGIMAYCAEPRGVNHFRSGSHCINWVITPDSKVIFWEPGDSSWVTLTPSEVSSIYMMMS